MVSSRARCARGAARLFPPQLCRRRFSFSLGLGLLLRNQLAQAREAEAAAQEVVEAEEER